MLFLLALVLVLGTPVWPPAVPDSDSHEDRLYNKVGTIEGKAVIPKTKQGTIPARNYYFLFQRADCKRAIIGVRTDADGNYVLHVGFGKYRVIAREGSREGETIDVLAPSQPRVVEVSSAIDPVKFDIELKFPAH